MYKSNSVPNKEIAEYSNPYELMPTQCCPAFNGTNADLMSHGKPRHKRISKVFDPIELLMPIDP